MPTAHLGAAGGDLDAAARALDDPSSLTADAADRLRRAVDAAVDHVCQGAAAAAALSLLVLLTFAPRRFPVLTDEPTDR